MIAFGPYWFYDLYRTDNVSSGNASLPTIIVILGAVLIYLAFEGAITRLKGKKATPLPPPPP